MTGAHCINPNRALDSVERRGRASLSSRKGRVQKSVLREQIESGRERAVGRGWTESEESKRQQQSTAGRGRRRGRETINNGGTICREEDHKNGQERRGQEAAKAAGN